jgi:hypothetical protein
MESVATLIRRRTWPLKVPAERLTRIVLRRLAGDDGPTKSRLIALSTISFIAQR